MGCVIWSLKWKGNESVSSAESIRKWSLQSLNLFLTVVLFSGGVANVASVIFLWPDPARTCPVNHIQLNFENHPYLRKVTTNHCPRFPMRDEIGRGGSGGEFLTSVECACNSLRGLMTKCKLPGGNYQHPPKPPCKDQMITYSATEKETPKCSLLAGWRVFLGRVPFIENFKKTRLLEQRYLNSNIWLIDIVTSSTLSVNDILVV